MFSRYERRVLTHFNGIGEPTDFVCDSKHLTSNVDPVVNFRISGFASRMHS